MATVQFDWYSKLLASEEGGELLADSYAIDFLSDTIKIALATNAYTPNLDTHKVFSDITNEVAGGGGYTSGGNALASKTVTLSAANSFAVSRANGTPYVVGDVVRPAAGNGFLYRCVVAGTSAGAPPSYSTTIGRETADGATLIWTTLGTAILVLDAADPSWAGAAFTARYGIIYKDTGTASTSPLMLLGTFSADVTSSGGTFAVTLPNQIPGFGYKARA
jgi:hypothetical protein